MSGQPWDEEQDSAGRACPFCGPDSWHTVQDLRTGFVTGTLPNAGVVQVEWCKAQWRAYHAIMRDILAREIEEQKEEHANATSDCEDYPVSKWIR